MNRPAKPNWHHLVFVLAALFGAWLLFLSPQLMCAQTETILHSFAKSSGDGYFPVAIVRSKSGAILGSTQYGGTANQGTVFALVKSSERIAYSFAGPPDGASGDALLWDGKGVVYGVTSLGGNAACNNGNGCGTVFKLSSSGKETVIHAFAGPPTDGEFPLALVRDKAGNLFGVTQLGGASNGGIVFRIDVDGNYSTLYSWKNGADGANPNGLIIDQNADLYGTTAFGGPLNAGTVFKIDALGNETTLYQFLGGNGGMDGKNPYGNLVEDSAGNLYGTTNIGGTANLGTLFKVDSSSGKETVLHSFGYTGDGAYPGYVAMDKAGNIYGNTSDGGSFQYGVVYKFDNKGNETILHNFGQNEDGKYPQGTLALGPNGEVFGSTQQGGRAGWGTVFEIVP